MLIMKVLGEMSFAVDGVTIPPLRSRTAAALFVYLTCHQRPFTRDYLAEFFWEGREPSQASANLRTALKLLRPAFADYLTITRRTVAFNHDADYEIDALTFARQVNALSPQAKLPLTAETAVQLAAILAQYQGDFLQGFHLSKTLGFEEWQTLQQARYRRMVERGLRRLVQFYLENGRYDDGIDAATRLLTFNPLDEAVHRQLMALLWRSGQRHAALQQYETIRRLLAEELNLPPTPETNALYRQIRTPRQTNSNLPLQTTSFVGREQDLQALADNLSSPDCRLLTILGPGGVGKTRLLAELGQKTAAAPPGRFAHGVCYVPLVHLNNTQFLVTAIAEALGSSLSGSAEPPEELLNYLREKELLLLLDNFEHLLEGKENAGRSLELISQILQEAPHVKIVTSSRVRLQLQAECVFDLSGLRVPPPDWGEEEGVVAETAVSFDAIQLFLQSARRVRRSFTTTADKLRTIAHVCRLLDGLPLGIEMAASWVRQLSCSEILQHIETDLDFLQLPGRTAPARHRTLRVVFDMSWALLQREETAVMRRLSIFHGPFTLKAAQAVAGATLSTLSGLRDKSFLQMHEQASGIVYDMHTLLQQYASERLAQQPQEQQQTATAHAKFYADFVQQRADALKNGGPKSVFNEIAEIIDDIRTAWKWSLHHRCLEYVDRPLEGLFYFYWARGWLQEGATMAGLVMETAGNSAAANELLATRGQMWLADFYGWQGRYDESAALFEQTVHTSHKLKAMPELIFALNGLGRIQFWQGAYEEAESTFETCLATAQRADDKHTIALTLSSLSVTVSEAKMDYRRGWTLLEESLIISRQINDQFGCARALINMGTLAQKQGWIEKAKRLYMESLAIYREIGYQHGIGAALNYLGQTAYLNEEYELARTLIYESYELNRESGDRRAMIDSLKQLGNATREAGNPAEAQGYYREALRLAQALETNPMVLAVLMETAVLRQHNDRVEAAALLLFVTHHPATGKELSDAAQDTAAALLSQLPAAEQAACRQQAAALTLTGAVQLALGHASPGRNFNASHAVS